LSPQYAHRISDGSIPRIVNAFSISSSVGTTTGINALTNAFVMLDFRDAIVCGEGIRKADRSNFFRAASSSGVTWCGLPARSHGVSSTVLESDAKAFRRQKPDRSRKRKQTSKTRRNRYGARPSQPWQSSYGEPAGARLARAGRTRRFREPPSIACEEWHILACASIFPLIRLWEQVTMLPNQEQQ